MLVTAFALDLHALLPRVVGIEHVIEDELKKSRGAFTAARSAS